MTDIAGKERLSMLFLYVRRLSAEPNVEKADFLWAIS